MSKPGSFGAGEEQPHAVICPSNLFRRGGEDALLQPEGLRWQRLPQLVSRQARLELQRQEAMSSDGGTWPCIPQPTSPHLVHGLLRPLRVAAIGLRHVAHWQRHRLEGVIPVRQSGVSRCCCTQGSSPVHVLIDTTQVQSPPNSSLDVALRSSPGGRDGQTLAAANPDGMAVTTCPGSPCTPLSSDLQRSAQPNTRPGGRCAQQVNNLYPSVMGREERNITPPPPADPPALTGGSLGDMRLCWLGCRAWGSP